LNVGKVNASVPDVYAFMLFGQPYIIKIHTTELRNLRYDTI